MIIAIKKSIPFLLLNAVIGLSIIIIISNREGSNSVIQRYDQKGYTFTSPIIDCQNTEASSGAINYREVEIATKNLAEEFKLTRFSVYFRDLNNGQWIGINEKEIFSPASLMKTPLLIALLKNAENDSLLLQKKIRVTENNSISPVEQNILPIKQLEKGSDYTIGELAGHMITYSDNTASILLSSYISETDYQDLFSAVGINIEKEGGDALVRIKDFASFFRILYNASYLNRDMSELALSLLSKTEFSGGLSSGVPSGIFVAHKYGERQVRNVDTKAISGRQFHDCGIIYHPEKPFILCVMTQGNSFDEQITFVTQVSRLFYQKVDSTD